MTTRKFKNLTDIIENFDHLMEGHTATSNKNDLYQVIDKLIEQHSLNISDVRAQITSELTKYIDSKFEEVINPTADASIAKLISEYEQDWQKKYLMIPKKAFPFSTAGRLRDPSLRISGSAENYAPPFRSRIFGRSRAFFYVDDFGDMKILAKGATATDRGEFFYSYIPDYSSTNIPSQPIVTDDVFRPHSLKDHERIVEVMGSNDLLIVLVEDTNDIRNSYPAFIHLSGTLDNNVLLHPMHKDSLFYGNARFAYPDNTSFKSEVTNLYERNNKEEISDFLRMCFDGFLTVFEEGNVLYLVLIAFITRTNTSIRFVRFYLDELAHSDNPPKPTFGFQDIERDKLFYLRDPSSGRKIYMDNTSGEISLFQDLVRNNQDAHYHKHMKISETEESSSSYRFHKYRTMYTNITAGSINDSMFCVGVHTIYNPPKTRIRIAYDFNFSYGSQKNERTKEYYYASRLITHRIVWDIDLRTREITLDPEHADSDRIIPNRKLDDNEFSKAVKIGTNTPITYAVARKDIDVNYSTYYIGGPKNVYAAVNYPDVLSIGRKAHSLYFVYSGGDISELSFSNKLKCDLEGSFNPISDDTSVVVVSADVSKQTKVAIDRSVHPIQISDNSFIVVDKQGKLSSDYKAKKITIDRTPANYKNYGYVAEFEKLPYARNGEGWGPGSYTVSDYKLEARNETNRVSYAMDVIFDRDNGFVTVRDSTTNPPSYLLHYMCMYTYFDTNFELVRRYSGDNRNVVDLDRHYKQGRFAFINPSEDKAIANQTSQLYFSDAADQSSITDGYKHLHEFVKRRVEHYNGKLMFLDPGISGVIGFYPIRGTQIAVGYVAAPIMIKNKVTISNISNKKVNEARLFKMHFVCRYQTTLITNGRSYPLARDPVILHDEVTSLKFFDEPRYSLHRAVIGDASDTYVLHEREVNDKTMIFANKKPNGKYDIAIDLKPQVDVMSDLNKSVGDTIGYTLPWMAEQYYLTDVELTDSNFRIGNVRRIAKGTDEEWRCQYDRWGKINFMYDNDLGICYTKFDKYRNHYIAYSCLQGDLQVALPSARNYPREMNTLNPQVLFSYKPTASWFVSIIEDIPILLMGEYHTLPVGRYDISKLSGITYKNTTLYMYVVIRENRLVVEFKNQLITSETNNLLVAVIRTGNDSITSIHSEPVVRLDNISISATDEQRERIEKGADYAPFNLTTENR